MKYVKGFLKLWLMQRRRANIHAMPSTSKKTKAKSEDLITRHWNVGEIVLHHPAAADVLTEWGLHCATCAVGEFERLEDGMKMHGFDDKDIDMVVSDINDAIAESPSKPQELHVTKDAALAIKKIGEESDEVGKGLSVGADADGSFFLEFKEKKSKGDKTFINEEIPEIEIWASPLTLSRIGGSTIDCVEGKIKLVV